MATENFIASPSDARQSPVIISGVRGLKLLNRHSESDDDNDSQPNTERTMIRSASLTLLLASLSAAAARADDWPQWLGPAQAAEWREEGIIEQFPQGGIPAKWRAPVGLGYSGPAVADGKVYVFDYVLQEGGVNNNPNARAEVKGRERLQCLSAEDGSLVWKHEYEAPYNISYPSGPRTTPTVDGDRVYALGAEGHLSCLSVSDGAVVWSKDLKSEYGVDSPLWGFSASPVVDGARLYIMVGGEGHAVVALDKQSGKEIWRSLSAPDAGYSTPTVIKAADKPQLVVWTTLTLNGLNPETGKPYWSIDLKPDYGMSIMLPRKEGNYLYASGIGNVGALVELDAEKPGAEIVWRGKAKEAVYCANSTPLIEQDTIYGADCRTGALTAVDMKDGERLWETWRPTTGTDRPTGHGTAFLVRHDDRYFLFSETGDLIMARLTPEKYEELGRMHLIDPTNEAFGRPVVWSHPAFAGKCVFARNDKEIVCVSLAK
jgi:outer membrane protein assembly factor BamB